MTPRMTDEELDALELKLTKPMQLHGMAILSDVDVTALLTECRRARAAEGAGLERNASRARTRIKLRAAEQARAKRIRAALDWLVRIADPVGGEHPALIEARAALTATEGGGA